MPKQGHLTAANEWWQHLRPFLRRVYWKGERRAARRDAAAQARCALRPESARTATAAARMRPLR